MYRVTRHYQYQPPRKREGTSIKVNLQKECLEYLPERPFETTFLTEKVFWRIWVLHPGDPLFGGRGRGGAGLCQVLPVLLCFVLLSGLFQLKLYKNDSERVLKTSYTLNSDNFVGTERGEIRKNNVTQSSYFAIVLKDDTVIFGLDIDNQGAVEGSTFDEWSSIFDDIFQSGKLISDLTLEVFYWIIKYLIGHIQMSSSHISIPEIWQWTFLGLKLQESIKGNVIF